MNPRALLAVVLSAFLLQGCIAAAVVGTAAVATKTTVDPRSTGTQIDDTTLELRVNNELGKITEFKTGARVVAVAYKEQILLTGQIPNEQLRQKAQNIVAKVDGVRIVYNEIRLGNSISLGAVSSDSWITTKLRSKLLTTDKVKSNNVKVVTENGEVFLLGVVTQKEAQAVADIASRINDVKRVTLVFNYLD